MYGFVLETVLVSKALKAKLLLLPCWLSFLYCEGLIFIFSHLCVKNKNLTFYMYCE